MVDAVGTVECLGDHRAEGSAHEGEIREVAVAAEARGVRLDVRRLMTSAEPVSQAALIEVTPSLKVTEPVGVTPAPLTVAV